jgi:hypothetical protein
MRDHFSDLEGVLLDLYGNEVKERTSVPGGARELFNGDPIDWPRLLQEFPEINQFWKWAVTTGEAESIPDKFRYQLLRVDQFFFLRGLARPFSAP